MLQANLLQSEVICSQPGVVNLQNDSGIVDGGCKDLTVGKTGKNTVNTVN